MISITTPTTTPIAIGTILPPSDPAGEGGSVSKDDDGVVDRKDDPVTVAVGLEAVPSCELVAETSLLF